MFNDEFHALPVVPVVVASAHNDEVAAGLRLHAGVPVGVEPSTGGAFNRGDALPFAVCVLVLLFVGLLEDACRGHRAAIGYESSVFLRLIYLWVRKHWVCSLAHVRYSVNCSLSGRGRQLRSCAARSIE